MTSQSATELTSELAWARGWLAKTKSDFLGGRFSSVDRPPTQSVNPSDQNIVGEFVTSTPDSVERAVTSALAAFQSPGWAGLSRKERARKLRQIAEITRQNAARLATIETLDNGKLFKESLVDDLPETADVFDYFAGWTDKLYGEVNPVDSSFLSYSTREPLGVCGLIVPWNFPLLLAAWKMAPALAMGNTVVVKPAPDTSLSLLYWIEVVNEAKILPPGVLNVVLGGADVGDMLTRNPKVAKVSFTGSTAVGRKVLEASAQSNLKQVTLELGGKSPNILFEDTPELEKTLQRAFTAMFSHKGEKCSEPTRLLVHKSLEAKTLAFLKAKADAVLCGDPFDPKSEQGAQCNRAQFDKILKYIEIGKKEGAHLLAGGTADTTGKNSKGFFIRPTVFCEVQSQMKIAQEEIFGPVLAVQSFQTEEEAVQAANATPYGLAAGLYTSNVEKAQRVARRLEAGMVFINHYGCYDLASPFGGVKSSGWGRELGRVGAESFTKMKTIWLKA